MQVARAHALLAGRDHVAPEDVQAVAAACLAHRLVDATNGDLPAARHWVAEVLAQRPVPPRPGADDTRSGAVPPAPAAAGNPDRTTRRLRARPPLAGVVGLALLAGLLALATRHGTLAMLVVALAGVALFDALSARTALAGIRLTVTNPIDAVAGEPSVHVVQAHGLRRPGGAGPPVWWPTFVRASVALRSTEPGTVVIDAPARGVVTHMVFDLIATGPLGLTEAACRVRVWLPVPLARRPGAARPRPDLAGAADRPRRASPRRSPRATTSSVASAPTRGATPGGRCTGRRRRTGAPSWSRSATASSRSPCASCWS